MTVYDDMRGFIHAHDRNGRFDVATETTPMYQMVDKAAAKNEKLREFARRAYSFSYNCYHGAFDQEVFFDLRDRMRELGIEVGE